MMFNSMLRINNKIISTINNASVKIIRHDVANLLRLFNKHKIFLKTHAQKNKMG